MFRENQRILIFCTIGLMIGGFVLFRYLPLKKKMKTLNSEKGEIQIAINKASTQANQLPELEKHLSALQNSVGNYELKIPGNSELGKFLQQISELMNEYNLKEQLIEPDKEMEAEDMKCIPVKMHCKGTLSQLFEFYKEMQLLERLIRIEQIQLKNDKDFTGEVSMGTKAVIYYRPEMIQG